MFYQVGKKYSIGEKFITIVLPNLDNFHHRINFVLHGSSMEINAPQNV